jgi:hypothetical protein
MADTKFHLDVHVFFTLQGTHSWGAEELLTVSDGM